MVKNHRLVFPQLASLGAWREEGGRMVEGEGDGVSVGVGQIQMCKTPGVGMDLRPGEHKPRM